MKKIQLHCSQIDFVTIKVDVDANTKIKMENLEEHPTIKNQYKLKSSLGENLKNFAIYFTKNNVAIIKMSIPYFLYGHNYKWIDIDDLKQLVDSLQQLLGLNIAHGVLKEFEYGAFEQIEIMPDQYLKTIVGMGDFDLEKSTSYMRMYGNQDKAIHYKMYDAVANSKVKRTLGIAKLPNKTIIKHEIKFLNPTKYFGRSIFFNELLEEGFLTSKFLSALCKILNDYREKIIFKEEKYFKPLKSDLIHILFSTLKNIEQQNEKQRFTIYKELLQTIAVSDLSPSQKCKRKKAIQLLEDSYNESNNA